MTRNRICDKCKGEILSKDKYIKCVEVGDRKDEKDNYNYVRTVRTMNGVGDLCISCFKMVIKK